MPIHAVLAAEEILAAADVVAATCVGAGDPRLAACTFRVCALDEASQATEPAALIPLLSQCQAAVLVGDPCQLPPTVVSRQVGCSKQVLTTTTRI